MSPPAPRLSFPALLFPGSEHKPSHKPSRSDVLNADEAFLTSTSLCLCPIKSLNKNKIGDSDDAWGPVRSRSDLLSERDEY